MKSASLTCLASLLALSAAAGARADLPFTPTKAVCFRAQPGRGSTPKTPVYAKAEVLVVQAAAACAGPNTSLAALCDVHARTQFQGQFKTTWNSPWERDHLLEADVQSMCARKVGTVTDVTKDASNKKKHAQ